MLKCCPTPGLGHSFSSVEVNPKISKSSVIGMGFLVGSEGSAQLFTLQYILKS